MQRLSGVDAGFLSGETAAWHMHVGAIVILDPSTAPTPFGVESLRALIASRLPRLGPFHHRVSAPALCVGRPRWVDAPDLDLDRHVKIARLPAPRGMRELTSFAAEVFSRKLDRDRPLWEMWLAEGLPDGRAALVIKVHHACVDGVRSMQLYGTLFDVTPDAPLARPGCDPEPYDTLPSSIEWARALASDLAGAPARGARAVGAIGGAGTRVARLVRSPDHHDIALPFAAPRSPVNGTLTARRSVALCSLPLTDVRAVRGTHGATVNDVVLAVCTGALRRYLLETGTRPGRPLIAQVPVGVHHDVVPAHADGVPGNFVSAMATRLPVHLADPAARLHAIMESTRGAKAMHRALGEDILLDLVDAVPWFVISALVSSYTRLRLDRLHRPIFNVLVSNVRGPGVPLYLAGARMVSNYAFGPLLVGCGLNVTAASYLDQVDVGLLACPDVVRDVQRIAAALPDALRELAA